MQWPPRPGPGLNDANPNGFVAAASIDLPDVDVHPVAQLRELVDERDVDGAVDVLEQLRQLGGLGCRDLVHRVERGAVDVGGRLRATPALMPPTTFGVVFVVQSSRPGSTRSGDIARWKSSPAFSPEPCLEDRLQRSRASCRARSSTRARRPGRAGAPARGSARRARCRRGRARAGARAASGSAISTACACFTCS